MLGGYRNRFANESKLSEIERLGKEGALPPEKQKSRGNNSGVRVDRG
jgi:hypothetical protein